MSNFQDIFQQIIDTEELSEEFDNEDSLISSSLQRTQRFHMSLLSPRNLLTNFNDVCDKDILNNDTKIDSVLYDKEIEDDVCPICYEENTEKKLNCSHCFHEECIKKWLQSKNTCPYCRVDVFKNN